MDLTEAIVALGLQGAVPGLTSSIARSGAAIGRLREALANFDLGDGAMDVVAFGSLARQEYTAASDIDYLVLVDQMPSDPSVPHTLLQLVRAAALAEEDLDGVGKKPGDTGLFGRAVGIFDVINQIGLEGDTNFTHTVRMEIIQESVSLLKPAVHSKILRSAVSRYVTLFDVPKRLPPRFLLNDMLRYWRQITVDYQAKTPLAGPNEKAVLRYLKLLTTRKNFVASSILPLIAPRDETVSWEDYLQEIYSIPPLARLATVTKDAPADVKDAVRTVFTTIDLFVQRTDSEAKRDRFKKIPWDTRRDDDGYKEIRAASRQLQSAFETILMDWDAVREKSREYLLL